MSKNLHGNRALIVHRSLLIIIPLLLYGCDQTPTGREQLALVPESMMADFGRQTFVQMQQQLPISADESANRTPGK